MSYDVLDGAKPEPAEPVAVRSHQIVTLFEKRVLDAVTTTLTSDGIDCGPFRLFCLYLAVDSTLTPTTVQFKVQFLDRLLGQWHTHKQGPFAALFYEDADTASGIFESFVGDVGGRVFRLVATGVGTSAANKFTISASVEFYN